MSEEIEEIERQRLIRHIEKMLRLLQATNHAPAHRVQMDDEGRIWFVWWSLDRQRTAALRLDPDNRTWLYLLATTPQPRAHLSDPAHEVTDDAEGIASSVTEVLRFISSEGCEEGALA